MLLTWPSFNNIRLLLMAFMPVVIFYMIWLVNTSEAIRSEEGALLDLVCWPDGNAIPVIIACGSIIAIFVEIYGLYQLFKAGLPKLEHDVTNGLFYYIWALLIMIIIFLAIVFYSGLQSTIIRAKLKGGIAKAMIHYVSHLPSKVAIDRLQTRFHCCGRANYQEWFYIPWYLTGKDTGVDNVNLYNDDGPLQLVADSVPYSCCSIDVMRPCVHHHVTKKGLIYNYNPWDLTIYTDGCEEKVIKEMMLVSWRFICVMALIILAMILQVIAVRYLHTAYRNGLHIGNQIVSNAYLINSTDTPSTSGYKQMRRVFRNRRLRQSRTLEWIAGGYKRSRYLTTSASESNSSDELLKPIYE